MSKSGQNSLILGTQGGLGSDPGTNTLRFALRGSRLMECLTALLDVNFDKLSFKYYALVPMFPRFKQLLTT